MFSSTAVTPTVASWASLIAFAILAMLSSRVHSPQVEPVMTASFNGEIWARTQPKSQTRMKIVQGQAKLLTSGHFFYESVTENESTVGGGHRDGIRQPPTHRDFFHMSGFEEPQLIK